MEAELDRAVDFKEWRSAGKISDTDARVMKLPALGMCPRESNTKTCHCMELASSNQDFQHDMRALYCKVIEASNHDEGNWLLMSYMVPRWNKLKGKREITFRVPLFIDDGTARIFYLCKPQFCNLFGMSTKRFYNLLRRREAIVDSGGEASMYCWTDNGDAYKLGNMTYRAFRAEHWIEFMLKHGGYKPGDKLD